MRLGDFSRWLGEINELEHELYYPVQISLYSSFGFMAAVLSSPVASVPPAAAVSLCNSAFVISRIAFPLFENYLEPQRETSLLPTAGQFALLTFSLVGGKVVCHLAGQHLSLRQVLAIGGFACVSMAITKLALAELRKPLRA